LIWSILFVVLRMAVRPGRTADVLRDESDGCNDGETHLRPIGDSLALIQSSSLTSGESATTWDGVFKMIGRRWTSNQ
jgi:hypothetical protein